MFVDREVQGGKDGAFVKFSRNGVPQPVSRVPPTEIAVPPPKVVAQPPGDAILTT